MTFATWYDARMWRMRAAEARAVEPTEVGAQVPSAEAPAL